MNTVLAAKTGADTTFEFYVKTAPWTVGAYNLAVGEAVSLQVYMNNNWVNCYDSGGTQIQITSTKNPISVVSAGHYRLNKPLTASAVSLHADHEMMPKDH